MVGKIIVKDFPEIFRYDLGTELEIVRNHLSNIDFNKPGIHILKLQPGIGKTHAIKEFLKKQKNFLISTASHKLISGEYEGKGAKHWRNFKEKCEIYSKVEKLHSNGVSIQMICGLNHERCDKRRCAYWKQFQTKKAVAPLTYLPTDRVLAKRGPDAGKFKFDILIVDEAMKEFKEIKFDKEEIEKIITTIEKYVDEYSEIRNLLNDFFNFIDTNDFPSKKQTEEISQIKMMALREAINQKKWEDIKEISKLNIFELRKYIYYYNIHKDISSYPEPYLYYVFDLALQGVPIIFLDATFDEEAFNIILGRYIYENSIIERQLLINKELNSIFDLDFKYYESNLKNKEIDVYRMEKDNYYYKKGLFNYDRTSEDIITVNGHKTINELQDYIKKTQRKYTNVGVITYKNLVPYFNNLVATEYFFNNRGSNQLENVEILFIIGTPQPRPIDIIKEYNNLCLTNITHGNTNRMFYEKSEDGYHKYMNIHGKKTIYKNGFGSWKEKKPSPLIMAGYDDYENELKYDQQVQTGIVDADVFYPLPDFDYKKTESEKYQAVHRARLFNKETGIYIFGDVPDQIKDEFNVKNLDKNHTKKYFNGTPFTKSQFNGIYPLPLYHLIFETKYKNNSLKSKDIARNLKLYKQNKESGYNTTFITNIIEGNINLKQITSIHNALKKGITDLKRIKKDSKADEKFIQDCIYYSHKGDFVESK